MTRGQENKPAPAQDEQEFNTSDSDLTELLNIAADMLKGVGGGMDLGIYFAAVLERVEQRLAARPAQTEQQPVGYQFQDREGVWKQFMSQRHYEDTLADGTWPIRAIYAAPIAQTEQQPEQSELVTIQRWILERFLEVDEALDEQGRTIENLTNYDMAVGCIRRALSAPIAQTALSAVTAERDRLRSKWARVESERDRLLSDNASLRGSCKALGEENKQLKREIKRQGRTIAAMAAKEA